MNVATFSLAGLISLSFSIALPAQTLLVSTGEVKHINSDYNPIYLDKLEMQAGSKIVLDQNLPNHIWKVQIKEAVFALDTIIDATGAPGPKVADQTAVPPEAAECQSGGQVAAAGIPGAPGQSGVDLNILMGIRQLGHLYIYNSGGAGGTGGRGGIGAKGGNANCSCDGGLGGTGGIGGPGGPGGDTSHVIINWYSLTNFNAHPAPTERPQQQHPQQQHPQQQTKQDPKENPKNLPVVLDMPVGLEVQGGPGPAGGGGPGGPEGPAGGAHCCTFWCKGSGGGGSPGPPGPPGSTGHYNEPVIHRINPEAIRTLLQ
jgi:hypothetical protein